MIGYNWRWREGAGAERAKEGRREGSHNNWVSGSERQGRSGRERGKEWASECGMNGESMKERMNEWVKKKKVVMS